MNPVLDWIAIRCILLLRPLRLLHFPALKLVQRSFSADVSAEYSADCLVYIVATRYSRVRLAWALRFVRRPELLKRHVGTAKPPSFVSPGHIAVSFIVRVEAHGGVVGGRGVELVVVVVGLGPRGKEVDLEVILGGLWVSVEIDLLKWACLVLKLAEYILKNWYNLIYCPIFAIFAAALEPFCGVLERR